MNKKEEYEYEKQCNEIEAEYNGYKITDYETYRQHVKILFAVALIVYFVAGLMVGLLG